MKAPAIASPNATALLGAANTRTIQQLLHVLPSAAYTCDVTGVITYFNKHAADLWGREPKLNELSDRYCGSHKMFSVDGTPMSHDNSWMALAIKHDHAYDGFEMILERPDGSRRTALAHASPLRDDTGSLSGAVNVLIDISDRRNVEDALREADLRKEEFLATLAHELRNPLAPIRNALELMRLDRDNGSTMDQARSIMERQLQQMVRLVDDLMDISRITRNKMVLRRERTTLSTIIHSAVDQTRTVIDQHHHQLTVSLPVTPIYLNADFTRMSQVFANLLVNSAKYMERGGNIWLNAEVQRKEVLVRVRDTGIGIAQEMLTRIFEPFMQGDRSLERSQGGLGIGLSLVKGLVEMHAGSIHAKSDGPGMGSEFLVRLPIFDPTGNLADPYPDDETIANSKCRVLVVDDNVDSATSMAAMLDLMGNETYLAHDGLAAVKAAEVYRPDVILLDIGLPKLNGYDVARKIRRMSFGKRAFLIAVSGWGQLEDRHRSSDAGFNMHLVKPVNPSELVKLLNGFTWHQH